MQALVIHINSDETWNELLRSIEETSKERGWHVIGSIVVDRLKTQINTSVVCTQCHCRYTEGHTLGRMYCSFMYKGKKLKCDHETRPSPMHPDATRHISLRYLHLLKNKPPFTSAVKAVLYFSTDDMADPDLSYVTLRISESCAVFD